MLAVGFIGLAGCTDTEDVRYRNVGEKLAGSGEVIRYVHQKPDQEMLNLLRGETCGRLIRTPEDDADRRASLSCGRRYLGRSPLAIPPPFELPPR